MHFATVLRVVVPAYNLPGEKCRTASACTRVADYYARVTDRRNRTPDYRHLKPNARHPANSPPNPGAGPRLGKRKPAPHALADSVGTAGWLPHDSYEVRCAPVSANSRSFDAAGQRKQSTAFEPEKCRRHKQNGAGARKACFLHTSLKISG